MVVNCFRYKIGNNKICPHDTNKKCITEQVCFDTYNNHHKQETTISVVFTFSFNALAEDDFCFVF